MLSRHSLTEQANDQQSWHHTFSVTLRLTQPLSWGDPKMFIPLTVFDAFFRNEASLECDKLVVDSLNTFNRLQQSPPRKPTE